MAGRIESLFIAMTCVALVIFMLLVGKCCISKNVRFIERRLYEAVSSMLCWRSQFVAYGMQSQ